MNPEVISISENISLNIMTPLVSLSVFDSVTVSESFDSVGVLTQFGIAMVVGQTYKLTFDADISSGGELKVFQGTQQIYDTAVTRLPVHEMVFLAEVVTLVRIGPTILTPSVFDTVTVTENFQMQLATLKPNKFDSVTITESITLNIV